MSSCHLLLFADGTGIDSWCSGSQSSLDPAGPQAAQISDLFSDFFWVSVIVFVLVGLMLAGALILRGRRTLLAPITQPSPFGETIRAWIVGTALVATTAVLFFLL